MSSTGTVISTRVFAALRDSTVAAQAGIAGATWSSTAVPRVFRGFTGYLAGRNRGRLPFMEFDLETQGFAHETLEGGTLTSSIRVRAHCGGRDPQAAGDMLEGMLAAGLAVIRSEATDNYTALGGDQISALDQGPWGHVREATLTIEHTFARSDYEVA